MNTFDLIHDVVVSTPPTVVALCAYFATKKNEKKIDETKTKLTPNGGHVGGESLADTINSFIQRFDSQDETLGEIDTRLKAVEEKTSTVIEKVDGVTSARDHKIDSLHDDVAAGVATVAKRDATIAEMKRDHP